MVTSRNLASKDSLIRSSNLKADFPSFAISLRPLQDARRTSWSMVIWISNHMVPDGLIDSAQLSQRLKAILCMEEVLQMMAMLHSHVCSLLRLVKIKVCHFQESALFLRLRKNQEVQTSLLSSKLQKKQLVSQMPSSVWTLVHSTTSNSGSLVH